MMVYDACRKKIVALRRQHRHRRRPRRAPGSTRPGSGTARAGRVDEDRRAGAGSTIRTTHGYYQHGLRRRPRQDRPLLLLNYIWEYDPATPAWTAVTADATKVDTASRPTTYAELVYDAGRAEARHVRRPAARPARSWELNAHRLHLGQPIGRRPTVRSSASTRRSRSTARRGKLMVFGGYSSVDSLYKQDIWEWSGTDATLTNRTNGRHEAARALPGRHGLRQQARPAAAVRRLRAPALYDDLWSWDADHARLDADHRQRARARRRATATGCSTTPVRDKVYVYGRTRAATRTGSSIPPLNNWKDRTVTLAADGRVAQLLRRHVRQRPRQDRRRSAATDDSATTPTSGSGTPPPASGRRRCRPRARPVPDGRYYHAIAYDSDPARDLMVGGHAYVTGLNTDRQRLVGVGRPYLSTWTRDDAAGREAAAARATT